MLIDDMYIASLKEKAIEMYGTLTEELNERIQREYPLFFPHRKQFLILSSLVRHFLQPEGILYAANGCMDNSLIAHLYGLTEIDPLERSNISPHGLGLDERLLFRDGRKTNHLDMNLIIQADRFKEAENYLTTMENVQKVDHPHHDMSDPACPATWFILTLTSGEEISLHLIPSDSLATLAEYRDRTGIDPHTIFPEDDSEFMVQVRELGKEKAIRNGVYQSDDHPSDRSDGIVFRDDLLAASRKPDIRFFPKAHIYQHALIDYRLEWYERYMAHDSSCEETQTG